MVRERVDRLVVDCAGDRHDPFRVVELTSDDLKSDPARLADEAAAFSMTGGRRAIVVDNPGEEATQLCKSAIDSGTADALIVLQAGELRPQSKLRKLFESEKEAAAIPCYDDSESDLAALVETGLAEHSISIDPDAIAILTAHLGPDRQLVRAEVAKLALYAGDQKRLTETDVRATIGNASAFVLDDLVQAAATGDQPAVETALQRAWRAEAAPVAVIRALQRHLQRLNHVAARVATGADTKEAMRSLRPPVFWKQEQQFRAQLRAWSPHALSEATARLLDAEVELKLGQAPDRSACARAVMSLAQMAARQRRH